MSFELTRGDTSPPMPVAVVDGSTAVDLSGADTVELRWVKPDGTLLNDALTAVDAEEGSFQMDWEDGDTDQVGVYFGHVVVTTGGAVRTYPRDGSRYIWWVNPTIDEYEQLDEDASTPSPAESATIRYTATGGESDFMVTLPTVMSTDEYSVSGTCAGVASIVAIDCPDLLDGDRTTTQFRVITSAALTTGDQLDFVIA